MMEIITLIAIGFALWFSYKQFQMKKQMPHYGKQFLRNNISSKSQDRGASSPFNLVSNQHEYKSSNAAEIAQFLKVLGDGIGQQAFCTLRVDNQDIVIPADAHVYFELEREHADNEIDISIKWRN